MEDHALQVLEFPKVVALLAERAVTPGGRRLAAALRPASTAERARRRLAETAEARRLLDERGEPPWEGAGDLARAVARARRGGVLAPRDLLEVAATLRAARRVRRYLAAGAAACPLLAAWGERLGQFPALEEEIGRAITPEGEVADAASPELAGLRRRVRELRARLRERLEELARSPAVRPHLQEPLVTVRADRFVLPVRQEARHQVPGVVHDQSASGATVFVEPLEAVPLNNELRRTELAAAREEERVLAALSRRLAAAAPGLLETAAALAHLDHAFARGRLGRDMNGVTPVLTEDGVVELPQARHPLLGARAVPVDIRLGRDFDTLVITGPNTGGKTVTLKTIGLLALMARAGLQIPAAPGSRVSFFRQVFADIGDEQSIEQSLSTFSAHMRHLAPVAERAGPGTLVLLDELGAGTDPAEGAALGMALLEHLQAAGARTVCTTHLSELKTFAFSRPRMENASMEFDVDTLAPTFRLAIGLPGRSNAFEIAARLGLKPEIVARARAYAGRERQEVDALLAALLRERQALAEERRAAEELRRRAEEVAARLEREEEETRARRAALLAEARQQARAVLEEARLQARAAVRRLRQAGPAEAEAVRRELGEALRAAAEALAPPPEGPAPAATPPSPPAVGERVRVRGTPIEGTLVAVDQDGRATVAAGALRVSVPLEQVAAVPAPAPGAAAPPGGGALPGTAAALARRKAETVSPEIHLRRLPVDEALARLDKYLDDAVLAGLEEVRVVHGKGAGVLRRAVAAFLDGHRLVAGYRLAGAGEGGSGVTVVRLKPRP